MGRDGAPPSRRPASARRPGAAHPDSRPGHGQRGRTAFPRRGPGLGLIQGVGSRPAGQPAMGGGRSAGRCFRRGRAGAGANTQSRHGPDAFGREASPANPWLRADSRSTVRDSLPLNLVVYTSLSGP
jgi:hypothetical protein